MNKEKRNNREELRKEIEEFLASSNEKTMLIKGTFQYEKHKEVIGKISNTAINGTKVLFRMDSMDNYKEFINISDDNGRIKSKTKYEFGNLNVYYDSIYSATWDLKERYDMAIFYKIDPLCSQKFEHNYERRNKIMNDLLERTIDKVFFVTCTDGGDYSWMKDFKIDREVIFDALEEKPAYHYAVLDLAVNCHTEL